MRTGRSTWVGSASSGDWLLLTPTLLSKAVKFSVVMSLRRNRKPAYPFLLHRDFTRRLTRHCASCPCRYANAGFPTSIRHLTRQASSIQYEYQIKTLVSVQKEERLVYPTIITGASLVTNRIATCQCSILLHKHCDNREFVNHPTVCNYTLSPEPIEDSQR